jgi:thiosulfate/3-mercaptopyruvate sulfurtransferase
MKYTTLISTDDLAKNLNTPNWVIFDCRAPLLDYQTSHIPESRHCHLEDDLSSPITAKSGRHPLPDIDKIVKCLGNWGVNNDTQIIAYDNTGGADYASRLWWQLRTLGHQNVAVLDGGFQQWEKSNKTLTQELPEIIPKTFTPNIDETQWLPTEAIVKNLSDKIFTVLDARAAERFRGEVEPFDTIAGRIPDAINRAFMLNLNEEGLFLSAQELRKQFNALLGNIAPQDIVHQCGSGVTACHNMLAMEIAGLTGSRLYAGSWSEWIRDESRPIAVN